MNNSCTGGTSGFPAASIGCVFSLLPNLISALFSFIGVVTLFMILVGAFRYITAGGDEKQLEEARKVLIYAAIGLGVVVFSFFIMNVLFKLLGITCLVPTVNGSGVIFCK